MKNNKGFSLTEIIVTIMIIVVLSAITGPIYNSYSTKTKAAEGYLLLGTIKDAQMKFYNENGTFYAIAGDGNANWHEYARSCVNNVLGIDARANKYYTRFDTAYGFVGGIKFSGDKGFVAVAFGNAGMASNITMLYTITSGTTFK